MESFNIKHVDLSRYDAFNFVHDCGFQWVKAKNKRPAEAWKSKGIHHTPDDVAFMNKCRAEGIREVGILTELSKLVVLDIDVTLAVKDERANRSDYSCFLLDNGNFMDGLANFMDVLRVKAERVQESNPKLFDELIGTAIELGLFAYGLKRGEVVAPKHFDAIAVTPSGGLHFYFKCEHPELYKLNSSGITHHVDVRAGGGIIIAPYSYREPVIEDGKKRPYYDAYFALTNFANMSELPPFIESILPKTTEKTVQAEVAIKTARAVSRHRVFFSSYQQKKDHDLHLKWLAEFAQSQKGVNRNSNLSHFYSNSMRLRTANATEVRDDYLNVGRSLSMSEDEMTATMRSADTWIASVGKFPT